MTDTKAFSSDPARPSGTVPGEVAAKLRTIADDPMWTNHVEISKATLMKAATLVARYEWLREHWNDDYVIGHERTPEQLDQFVDAALITGRIAP